MKKEYACVYIFFSTYTLHKYVYMIYNLFVKLFHKISFSFIILSQNLVAVDFLEL